jgi:hypothetical protein
LKRKHEELEEKVQHMYQSNDALRELLSHIRSRPEAEAASIFKKIRAGEDVNSVVRQTRDADLLLQLQLKPEKKRDPDLDASYNNYMPKAQEAKETPNTSTLACRNAFAKSVSKDLPTRDKYKPHYSESYHAKPIIDL